MMKLIIGLLVAALIAAGVWFSMQSERPVPDIDRIGSGAPQEKETSKARGTLASLFGMSGAYRCTVTSDAPTGFARGTVYVSDGDVRGEFVTTSQAGEMTATMIKTGEVVYTWSSAMPMGVKAAASSIEGGDGSTPASDTQMFDAGVDVEYDCTPTTVDAAMFVPPADIEFMDMTQGMPAMPDLSKMMR